jgi:predicted anti-sigma-YlaC factor YlaD
MSGKNVLLIGLILVSLNSCSVRKMVMTRFTETLSSQQSTVFTSDDDPQLIAEALPFTIKLYESLASKDSLNPELQLATGKLFCLYAQAFVSFPGDTLHDSLQAEKKAAGKRAKKLFLRGRDYILRGLDIKHPGFKNGIFSRSADSLLAITDINDTAYLYWGAVCWTSAIMADRSDLALAMTLKKAVSLAQRVLSLDQNFGAGAAHEFLAIYFASAPKAMGGDTVKAKEYFSKAVELSGGNKVSPYVYMASSLHLKSKNKEGFTDALNRAMAVKSPPESPNRLLNTIYQQRAAWMLRNIERFFPEEK